MGFPIPDLGIRAHEWANPVDRMMKCPCQSGGNKAFFSRYDHLEDKRENLLSKETDQPFQRRKGSVGNALALRLPSGALVGSLFHGDLFKESLPANSLGFSNLLAPFKKANGVPKIIDCNPSQGFDQNAFAAR
jgi:hypothetical protein